jgi:hypothetical protein
MCAINYAYDYAGQSIDFVGGQNSDSRVTRLKPVVGHLCDISLDVDLARGGFRPIMGVKPRIGWRRGFRLLSCMKPPFQLVKWRLRTRPFLHGHAGAPPPLLYPGHES